MSFFRRLPFLASFAIACVSLAVPTVCPAESASAAVPDEAFLETISERTFRWFWEETNPRNGLTPDRSPDGSFSSVAAVGFALTAYPIGVERGYVTRAEAIERTLRTLQFLHDAPQGTASRGLSGYRGFFYHFLDLETGARYRDVELSTIDTALLMNGVLFCQSYYDGSGPVEARIRELADRLYRRVEWDWALERPPLLGMGWDPDFGFIAVDYQGYSEAMFLYLLALGSPTYPIHESTWDVFTSTYVWGDFHGYEHINFSPLFGHQYTQVWVDCRGIQDVFLREKGIDFFENSRRASLSQQAYAIANPGGWKDYGQDIWGLTACDGPAGLTHEVNGEPRRFFTYNARGASLRGVLDDGTIAPTAAGGSIVFAPEIVMPALKAIRERYGSHVFTRHGFVDAFNPTFVFGDVPLNHGKVVPELGWFDDQYIGIDQGPILAMIENYRSELIWKTMKSNPNIVRGLRRAGFTGGWLEKLEPFPIGKIEYRDRSVLIREDDGDTVRIVVLGAAAAAGRGAADYGNSWAGRLQAFARELDPRLRVSNFARPGYSSYQLQPDGTPSIEGRGGPDRDRNITRAISRRPAAIILSVPDNDTAYGYSVEDQLRNYETITAAADAAKIPIWVTTPFPRDLPDEKREDLARLRDALLGRYDGRVIDLWKGFATDGDHPDPEFATPGGIYLNDAGHTEIFQRMVESGVVQRVAEKLAPEAVAVP